MSKWKCSICNYLYDETAGLPNNGITPGTKWEDISHDFVCPLCGAPKMVFEEFTENSKAAERVSSEDIHIDTLRELTAGELSALFSNAAKGCEKQYLSEETDLFYKLADYFKSKVASQNEKDFDDVANLLNINLTVDYSNANAAAETATDRGALRALAWSEKVSRMLNSLIDRYSKEGNKMLENTKIYVCDICGFVYVGNDLPERCPVCKVPDFKISQILRR